VAGLKVEEKVSWLGSFSVRRFWNLRLYPKARRLRGRAETCGRA
jgi:hypothetical protein